MPTGIEIRRSDGVSLITPDTRLCKVLGIMYTQGASFGRFDVPEWASAPGWVNMMSPVNYGDGYTLPDVYKEATSVSWSRYAGGNAPTAPVYLMWGIY
jgi:hypothetical protein